MISLHPAPHNPKPVIGLLGGIGSGKSLVARELARLGCAVIDADELAKAVLERPDVTRQLVQRWGPQVLGRDGRVDRKAVAQRVFDAAGELDWLESIVHPGVHADRQRLRRAHQQDPAIKAIVEDCPLLVEKGLDSTCDVLILVRASRDSRLRRVAAARGWNEDDLARREKNQVPLDTKAELADYVIDNDADEARCRAQVQRVLSRILHDTD